MNWVYRCEASIRDSMRVKCIKYNVNNVSPILIIGNWYEVVDAYVYESHYYIRISGISYLLHKDLFVTEVEYRNLQLYEILNR